MNKAAAERIRLEVLCLINNCVNVLMALEYQCEIAPTFSRIISSSCFFSDEFNLQVQIKLNLNDNEVIL